VFDNLARLLTEKLISSIVTLPSLTNWIELVCLLLIYASIALPIGFKTKFLYWNWQSSPKIISRIILTSLFAPAILEEIFFRVLLLPYPTEKLSIATSYFWIIVSLILFIIYHPLNAITFFPAGRKTFFNPIFLFSAALLGLIGTIAYLRSGSLWLTAFIHWVVVVIWLIFLGGYERLFK
jgi:predicted Abi (CAAX) family protease